MRGGLSGVWPGHFSKEQRGWSDLQRQQLVEGFFVLPFEVLFETQCFLAAEVECM